MKKNTIFFFIFLFFSISLFAYNPDTKDEFEVRYIKNPIHLNSEVQYNLRNQNAWQSFVSENPNWFVYFNEYNKKPHRAYGEPIINDASSDIELSSTNFMNNQLSMFDIDNVDLSNPIISSNDKYNSISYYQKYNGIDVVDLQLDGLLAISWTDCSPQEE